MVKDLGELSGPLLLFGGPYGNLAATQALHQQAQALGLAPAQVLCNGDLVAYCAEPQETVSLIRDWGIEVVMGNCEESLAAGALDCGCGFAEDSACSALSAEWYRFAKARISAADARWMGQLPRLIRFSLNGLRVVMVHGSPARINEFIFASTDTTLKQSYLEQLEADLIIGGHSGIPFGSQMPGGYWLNTGVIGMPANDGTNDGWYLLLTPEAEGVRARWQRLSYAVAESVAAMQHAGLSEPYQRCLNTGIWPSHDILPAIENAQTGVPLHVPELLIKRIT